MMNIENIANFLFLLAVVLCMTGACLRIIGFVLSLISTDSNTRRHNVKKITIQKCRPQISPDSVLGLLSIFEFAFFGIV